MIGDVVTELQRDNGKKNFYIHNYKKTEDNSGYGLDKTVLLIAFLYLWSCGDNLILGSTDCDSKCVC